MISTKEQLLAWDLSTALKDKKHFGFYCKLAKKNPEYKIRQVLKDVQDSKNWDRIKNKGAYFVKSFYNSTAING